MRINDFWITQCPQFTLGGLFRYCEEALPDLKTSACRAQRIGFLPGRAGLGERCDSANLYPGLIAPRTQQRFDRLHGNPAIHSAQRQLSVAGVHGVDEGRQAVDPRLGVQA